MNAIKRCISCEGYGWFEDEMGTGDVIDCDWCGGVGYVYHRDGVDIKIPATDWGKVSDQLENLERQRMAEMGYQGEAKRPWEQDVRQGTKGGVNPYAPDDDETEAE